MPLTDINAGFKANICFVEIATDGTKTGVFDGNGELTPNGTINNVEIVDFYWLADGTFVIGFNDVKLENIDSLLVYHPDIPDGNRADWDSTNLYYTFTDTDLEITIANGCFYIEFDPIILAEWNFVLQTGAR